MVLNEKRDKSLLRAKSQDAAELLCMLMSQISEDYYCAGWLIELEYMLWNTIKGGDKKFGFGVMSDEIIAKFHGLHERAGGWWRWDDECGDTVFVTTEEWYEHLAQQEKK